MSFSSVHFSLSAKLPNVASSAIFLPPARQLISRTATRTICHLGVSQRDGMWHVHVHVACACVLVHIRARLLK